ncbi:MAG: phage tail tube protein [Bauldia sp.]
MAESDALIGYGEAIALSRDAGANWLDIGEVTNLTPPALSTEEVAVTHSASPDATHEAIPGVNKFGPTTFDINWVPGSDTDELLRELVREREVVLLRITYPNDVTWTFSGFFNSVAPAAPIGDRLTASVGFTIRKSGIATGVAA